MQAGPEAVVEGRGWGWGGVGVPGALAGEGYQASLGGEVGELGWG